MTERIGDWVVEGPIGSGGMGTVYRCHNALTPRIKAAVKIIRSDRPESFRERFLREVESLEALHHPAVVRVKGWGEQEGMLWLAMDLVEGTDLEDVLATRNLTIEEATKVFTDVASGLAHAHERSVVHRDVKPANILIVPDGSGRIVDFGIAVQDGRTRLTAAGSMTGTPAYMAPEVFGGKPVGEMLDIYALGQALYESLTGAMAFPQPEGLTTTQQLAHVVGQKMSAEPLDPGPDYPEHLREIIRRATQPHPSKRIPTMRAFADAMQGGKLPPMEGASDTINLDFEAVEQAQAAAPAPRAPRPTNPTAVPPAPEPKKKRRAGGFITGALGAAVVLLLGVIALAAVVGLAAFFLWPRGERDVRVAIEGIPVGTPTAVWVGRKRAEPEIGGTIWHRADSPVVPQSVQVITGEACDVDAWDGTDCLPCCTCASAEVPADSDTVSLAITPPADTASVTLTTNDVPAPWTLRATSETLSVVETGRGRWRATGPAGEHSMAVSAGVCPDSALDCGSDCPAGCSSEVVEVTLTCGQAIEQSTVLRTPRRPLEPTPQPSVDPDTDGADSDTQADTDAPVVDDPEPVVDTPEPVAPEPTVLEPDKPGVEPESDKPSTQMTRPGSTPAPSPSPSPTPRPRWGSGTGGGPEIRVPGFTPEAGSLNGVSVLVRHREVDAESAAIAVSRLSRRGASVRSEAYDRPGADAQWGKLYYRTVDYNSSATLASSTLREVGYLTRLQRDLGTGDDIVVFLDPQ